MTRNRNRLEDPADKAKRENLANAQEAWLGRWIEECVECEGLGSYVECDECEGFGFLPKNCPHCDREMDDGDNFCEDCDSCRECSGCQCPECTKCGERDQGCEDYTLIDGRKVCEYCYEHHKPTHRQANYEAAREMWLEDRYRDI